MQDPSHCFVHFYCTNSTVPKIIDDDSAYLKTL